jgi:hypothetical protein
MAGLRVRLLIHHDPMINESGRVQLGAIDSEMCMTATAFCTKATLQFLVGLYTNIAILVEFRHRFEPLLPSSASTT